MELIEEYRNIPDLNGYECSNLGQIRNLAKGYYSFGSLTKKGYLRLYIRKPDKVYCYPVHRLVLLCFVGPCPDGYVTDHKDRVRSNNRLDNLQYITNIENCKQGGRSFKGKMREDGFGDRISEALSGEGHPSAKLKDEDILKIRELSDSGIFHRDIALIYKISRSQISKISRRESWDHI